MMNASVYIELSCEFGTLLFTLHCPQFRSTLKCFLCVYYIGFGLTSVYLDQKQLELYQNPRL
jgi:hypothetical protein